MTRFPPLDWIDLEIHYIAVRRERVEAKVGRCVAIEPKILHVLEICDIILEFECLRGPLYTIFNSCCDGQMMDTQQGRCIRKWSCLYM